MKDILIIVPTEREAEFFAGHDLTAHICGVGMAECAAATARALVGQRPGLAILAGVAGAYTDDIEVGETVVVTSETIADLGRWSGMVHDCCGECGEGKFTPLFQKTYPVPVVPEGCKAVRSYTVDMAGGLLAVAAPIEAEIENMEGAAFLAVCAALGVPAMEVRTVSNRVGEPVTVENLDLAARRLAAGLEEIVNRYL
jgi:nucleoside phosphorylase